MNTSMILMFVMWLAYGVVRWRQCIRWKENPPPVDRAKIPVIAIVWLFGSAAVLLGGLYGLVQAGGFPKSGILPWAWVGSLALGVIFVHGQVTAAALLFSMGLDGVTTPPGSASDVHREVTSAHGNTGMDGSGAADGNDGDGQRPNNA